MEKTLNSAGKFYFDFIRKPVSREKDPIVLQLRDTADRLRSAYSRFETEENEDLIESVIYEIQSLKSLYRYLIKRAKETGTECSEISVFEKELMW